VTADGVDGAGQPPLAAGQKSPGTPEAGVGGPVNPTSSSTPVAPVRTSKSKKRRERRKKSKHRNGAGVANLGAPSRPKQGPKVANKGAAVSVPVTKPPVDAPGAPGLVIDATCPGFTFATWNVKMRPGLMVSPFDFCLIVGARLHNRALIATACTNAQVAELIEYDHREGGVAFLPPGVIVPDKIDRFVSLRLSESAGVVVTPKTIKFGSIEPLPLVQFWTGAKTARSGGRLWELTYTPMLPGLTLVTARLAPKQGLFGAVWSTQAHDVVTDVVESRVALGAAGLLPGPETEAYLERRAARILEDEGLASRGPEGMAGPVAQAKRRWFWARANWAVFNAVTHALTTVARHPFVALVFVLLALVATWIMVRPEESPEPVDPLGTVVTRAVWGTDMSGAVGYALAEAQQWAFGTFPMLTRTQVVDIWLSRVSRVSAWVLNYALWLLVWYGVARLCVRLMGWLVVHALTFPFSSVARDIVVVLRDIRGRVPPGALVTAREVLAICGFALAEELLKSLGGTEAVAALITLEWVSVGSPWYVPTAVMHCCSYVLGPVVGSALHAGWNLAIIGPTQLPGDLLSTLWAGGFGEPRPLRGMCVHEMMWSPQPQAQSATIRRMGDPEYGDRPRFAIWPVGPIVPGVRPGVYRSCGHNECAAAATRICSGAQPWDADPASNLRSWKGMLDRLLTISDVLRVGEFRDAAARVGVPSFQSWNERYPIGQQARNVLGLQNAERNGLKPYLTVQAFIKVERLPYSLDSGVAKPRVIQGRSDPVKASTGPYFWGVGKWLAEAWDFNNKLTYAYDCTAEQLGDWAHTCEAAGFVPIGADVSSFDTCVGPGALEAEREFLTRFTQVPRVVAHFMALRRRPIKARFRCGAVVERTAQVCSGDADTSCGDTLIAGLVWAYLFEVVLRVPWRVLVKSDDAVVAVRPEHKALVQVKLPAVWTHFGFRQTMDPDVDWDTVEFCSGRFWRVGHSRVFAPRPGRVLAKTFWTTTDWRDKTQWLRGVLLGLERDVSCVPLLREVCWLLLREVGRTGRVVRPAPYRGDHKVHAAQLHDYDVGTATQFCGIYGCSLGDLAGALVWLGRQAKLCGRVMDHPLVQRVAMADCRPPDR
jgi:hypothetical protein